MSILDFVAVCLAGDAVLSAWFYGSIFEDRLDAFDKANEERPTFLNGLLTCQFCSSYHAPFWLLCGLLAARVFLPDPYCVLAMVPIYSLAATSVIQIFQGVHPYVRPFGELADREASASEQQGDQE